MMKTREDIFNALRKVCFVERTAKLAEVYRRIPGKKPFKPRKDKVYEIVNRKGYQCVYREGRYFIQDNSCNDIIVFKFDYFWVQISYRYYDGNEEIYRGGWGIIQGRVADNEDYRSGYPVVHSYNELEVILKEAISIYEESLTALQKNVRPDDVRIPDTKNLICLRTTKKDAMETLRKINFLERSTKMCKVFCHSSRIALPKVEKDKIFEIIRSYGYEVGYEYSCFYLKNQIYGPYRFVMKFCLKYFTADFQWYVYEDGTNIYGDVWLGLCEDLAEDKPFGPPYRPSFRNLEEFKLLIAEAFNMFEDFKYELCKSKGIDYTRIDTMKIWKDLYGGELKKAPDSDEH